MAISRFSNTLPSPSSQLAKDLMDGFISGMTSAIAAGKTDWSILDSGYVNGTSERVVFSNTAGFAIMLLRSTTLTNTQLHFFMGTSYNDTTHVLSNIGFGNPNSTPTAAADGFSGVTYNPTAVPAIGPGNAAPAPSGPGIHFLAQSSQGNWSIHVETDYVVFNFKDGTSGVGKTIWGGKFVSLVSNPAITDTYPFALVCFNFVTNQSNIGNLFLHSLNNGSKTIRHNAVPFTFPTNSTPALIGSYDKYSLNPAKAKLSYIYIARERWYTPVNSNDAGWLRGYLPGVYHGYADNAAWGDTVSIDGKAYMFGGGGTDIMQDRWISATGMSIWIEI